MFTIDAYQFPDHLEIIITNNATGIDRVEESYTFGNDVTFVNALMQAIELFAFRYGRAIPKKLEVPKEMVELLNKKMGVAMK